MTVIGVFGGVLALLVIGAVWKGYILTVLWDWFMVPTFGLSPLALAPAMGLILLVSFLTHQSDAVKEPEGTSYEKTVKAISYTLLLPAMVLGCGWVVKQFM